MSENYGVGVFKILLQYIFDIGFIFCPNAGYIHQYFKINKLKSAFGFSKLISFILIIAYILRIFFWIGKKFEIVILFQSIAGIGMQFLLIQKCVEFTAELRDKPNSDYFNYEEFWNWPKFLDYFYFIFSLMVFLNVTSNILSYNIVYVEMLGILSAMVEAGMIFPQIYENYKVKSVKTLSYFLVFAWMSGDVFKLVYYLITKSPVQLVGCACTQILGDFVLIFQIFRYGSGKRLSDGKIANIIEDRKVTEEDCKV